MTDAIAIIISVLAAIGGAFFIGSRKGRHDERATQIERDLAAGAEARKAAHKTKEKHDATVGNLSDDDLNKRLHDLRK